MADRITQIAAGEAHTLALTGEGWKGVFVGRGSLGRLGNGKDEDQLAPAPVKFNTSMKPHGVNKGREGESLRFIGVAAGSYHSLALRDDGSIWSWGYNVSRYTTSSYFFDYFMDGQLGQGKENSSFPVLVEQFMELGTTDGVADGSNASLGKSPLKICSVKAGGMMSFAIDTHGGLWMWGNCPQPDDSDNTDTCLRICPDPMPIWEFHGRTVVKVACGNEHVLALVTAGETFRGDDLICYSWGNNKHGQLGLGDVENRPRPQLVAMFNEESPWSVYEIACGAFHSAVLTQRKTAGEEIGCRCWTFGLGENGQLGLGTTTNSWFPQPVHGLPKDAIPLSLDCGLFHTCIVSATGDVWSWGMARGLGLCPDALRENGGDALQPVIMHSREPDGPKFRIPVQIACGAAHTILLANDGYKLWAWGRGRNGVLGRGNSADSFAPCAVMFPPHDGSGKSNETTTASASSVRRNRDREHRKPVPASSLDETPALQSKLRLIERYATILHAGIFGRPFDEQNLPQSLKESDFFDIKSELENTIESADDAALSRMEIFYRSMLRNVKNTIMKRKVREIVKECLQSRQT